MLVHDMKNRSRKNITYELNILGVSCSLGSNNRLEFLIHEHFYGFSLFVKSCILYQL